jgi:FkbM family methyltransferase
MARNLLNHNIRLGGVSGQVQVIPMALAGADGEEIFQTDDMSTASGTLDRVSHGAASQGRRQYGLPPLVEKVRVSRVDTLVQEGIIPKPNVIKIDVEGAEAWVLEGARETLRTAQPMLVVELHGIEAVRAVVQVLLGMGYFVFGYFRREYCDENYEEIRPADYDQITDEYGLHYLIASTDKSRVTSPIAPFTVRA